MPGRFNQREVVIRWHAALGRVDRESPEDLPVLGQNRLRPAGAYPEGQGELSIPVEPDRLACHVGDDDSRLKSRGSATQARIRIDRHGANRTRPLLGHLRTCNRPEAQPIWLHQQDGSD